jgi:hypothetical protein
MYISVTVSAYIACVVVYSVCVYNVYMYVCMNRNISTAVKPQI